MLSALTGTNSKKEYKNKYATTKQKIENKISTIFPSIRFRNFLSAARRTFS